MKIRKQHKGKRYRYNVNRKSLNKARSSTGKIKDPVMKKLWEDRKRPGRNFYEMGLSADPNKSVHTPSYRNDRLKAARIVNGFLEEEIDEDEEKQKKKAPPRSRNHVVKQLEDLANERPDPEFRLPKGVVSLLSYFMDKYKLNYKAMVVDKRNNDQWTWKQFRMKIRRFMTIPEQFNVYLEKKQLPTGKALDWPEYDSDSEWQ